MSRCLWFSIALGAGVLAFCQSAWAQRAPGEEDGDVLAEAVLQPHDETPPGSRRAPRWLAAGAQVGLIVGVGGVEYWMRHDGNPRWRLSHFKDRFSTTRWLILDTSTFATNYSYHTAAGAGYHLAARTNDLRVYESAMLSLGASLMWEYVVEYREKVDLNDIAFTTPAGVALGEFAHALGRLVHQQPAGRGWDVARWTLGFSQSFNDALGGVDSPRGPDIAHRFRLSTGASRAVATVTDGANADRASLYQVRVEGALAAMDDLYTAGSSWRGFGDGNFTSLDLVLTDGAGPDSGIHVLSDTFLAGWRYSVVSTGRGRALNLGSAMAVRYQREHIGAWRDRLGLAHLPGLAADGEVWGRNWRLRGVARLHPDYGGVHAISNKRWRAAHPDDVGLSTVEEQGYYHGYGLSGRLGVELAVPRLSVGGELFAGRYRPHHGRDKLRSELTVEQHIASRVTDHALWLRAALPASLFVEARMDSRHRGERFEELDASTRLRRYGIEVGAIF